MVELFSQEANIDRNSTSYSKETGGFGIRQEKNTHRRDGHAALVRSSLRRRRARICQGIPHSCTPTNAPDPTALWAMHARHPALDCWSNNQPNNKTTNPQTDQYKTNKPTTTNMVKHNQNQGFCFFQANPHYSLLQFLTGSGAAVRCLEIGCFL